jgi:hypothetical protein
MKLCKKCDQLKNESEFRLISIKNGNSYLSSPCKECCRKRYLQYNKENEIARKELRRKYRETKRQKDKLHYHSSDFVKMIITIRNDLNKLAKHGLMSKRMKQYFGIDFAGFKSYIQNQLTDDMTWENRGRDTWHFDHIKCLISANDIEELKTLMHYSNIRPLPAKENMGRGRFN